MHRFVFVLEHTLGHRSHAANLERALAREPEIDATIIRLPFTPPKPVAQVPGLRSWSFRASWAARSALHKRFSAGPVDAVFIHTQVAALFARGVTSRVPTILSLDATPLNFDTEGPSYGHRRNAEIVERAKWRINRRTFSSAATLVAWCHWAARSLVEDYGVPPTKVHVIRPGIDLTLFRPPDRQPEPGPVRLLFVGGDFARKGGPDLLSALRLVEGPVELDLVTQSEIGPIAEGLSCRIHRDVSPQSTELVDLYRRADIFALPSRGDVFPQAIAEAMACGLPVVASTAGATAEMVRDGENGYLVPPGSPRLLGRAVEALIDHPMLRKAMGSRGRALAVQEHDAARNSQTIFQLMRELADERVGARRSA